MSMRPITNFEFAQVMRTISPPGGWGKRLGARQSKTPMPHWPNMSSWPAVALSGGSDSVCLLFLLGRMLESVEARKTFAPNPVPKCLALTVDHGLQATSAAAAAETREYALSQSVPHHLLSIPWGESPFPPRPTPGEAFEELARMARNRLLLSAMLAEGASVMVFGHHADDQVETAIMRLNRGSGILGLAGMRKIRRWGMGDRDPRAIELGWAGPKGMRAWIIRPLLDFSKVHLLSPVDFSGFLLPFHYRAGFLPPVNNMG